MKLEHKVTKELVDRMIEIHFPFAGNQYEVTVMEMLDVIPSWITVTFKDGDVGNYKLEIGRQGLSDSTDAYYVHYVEGTGAYSFMLGTLPNALAEIILWLVENKYLTFTNEK